MNRAVSLMVAIVALSWVAVCAGETLEEVEQKIVQQVGKYKSLQFKMKTASEMSIPQGQIKTDTDMLARYEQRPEHRFVSRIEAETKMLQKPEGQPEQRSKMSLLTVVDDKFVYSLTKIADQTSATKQKLDPKTAPNPFEPAPLFKELHKQFNMKLLPDESLGGKSCWVIEVVPKDMETMGDITARGVTYYDKRTALSLKTIAYNRKGKVTTTTTTSDIKLDEDIPDSQFEFKAPPGVQVVDMSQFAAGEGSTSQPAENKASQEKSPTANDSSAKPNSDKPAEQPAEKKKDNSAGKTVKGLLKGLGR